MKCLNIFSIFVGHYCPPGSESGIQIRILIRIHWPEPIRIRILNTDPNYLGFGLEVAAESGHDVDEHVDAALSRVLLHAFRPVLHVADTAVVQRVPDWKNKNVPFHYFREIVAKSLYHIFHFLKILLTRVSLPFKESETPNFANLSDEFSWCCFRKFIKKTLRKCKMNFRLTIREPALHLKYIVVLLLSKQLF